MKKIVMLGLTVSLGILIAGCTSKVSDSASSSSGSLTTETSSSKPTTESSNSDNVPTEYKSALTKAKYYAETSFMSEKGIYNQLTSEYGEKFKPEAAKYAIEKLKVDWNNNAYQKAKNYQDQMAMSPKAIYDQLTSEYGEKFTPAQAKYAVEKLTGEKMEISSPSDSSSSSSSSESSSNSSSISNSSSSSSSSSSAAKTETKPSSEEKIKKAAKKSKFYIMDKIMSESSTIGNTEMTIDTYNDLSINGFTLEGCIAKFGVPQYATASSDGDIMQEVLYKSNEEGYSVGLVFKYDKNAGGFGSWKLDDKYAVETKGISIPEYTYNQ